MCAVALARIMPPSIDITLLTTKSADKTDSFYGSVTSPASYKFLLNCGIAEPDLLPVTTTAFSLGTRYRDWGLKKESWTQSFHLPLPLFNGVELHHYLNRQHQPGNESYALEPYIISAKVAQMGAFAHPPDERKTPLADMDYGYQFAPHEWSRFFASKINSARINCISGEIEAVSRKGDIVQSVTLSGGDVLEADFIIDALGVGSPLIHSSQQRVSTHQLRGISSTTPQDKLGAPLRTLTAKDYGWQADTPLQDSLHKLTVYAPKDEKTALKDHGPTKSTPIEVTLGKSKAPWNGNCLALGHGAAILEPLTPAPMMLLQRDIDRLIELIPVSASMNVEQREYNRRFTADYEHAELFQNTFFKTIETPNTPYWMASHKAPMTEKLANKLTQFENRGICVQYDYEPFTAQDWTMLHFGMGRRPKRYDPMADRIAEPQMAQTLDRMRRSVAMIAKKVPPHHDYMARLLKYLKETHG